MNLNNMLELVKQNLNDKLTDLESHFDADVISYTGPFYN